MITVMGLQIHRSKLLHFDFFEKLLSLSIEEDIYIPQVTTRALSELLKCVDFHIKHDPDFAQMKPLPRDRQQARKYRRKHFQDRICKRFDTQWVENLCNVPFLLSETLLAAHFLQNAYICCILLEELDKMDPSELSALLHFSNS
jgi:hypothetical protein